MPSTPVVVLDSTLTNIANAIRSKTGGSATMKPGQMPAQIASIPSGGGVGIPREVSAQGVYQIPSQSFAFSLPAGATAVGERALNGAFRDCTSLTSVDLSPLTAVSASSALYNAFYGCTSLTSVNLSSLATVSGSSAFNGAFRNCTSLTSVNLSSLTTVSGSSAFGDAFRDCTSLTSVNLSSLTTASTLNAFNSAFRNCTSLTSVNLSSLTTVSAGWVLAEAFSGCASLTSLSFPALTPSSFVPYTNQFNSMLNGCSNVTVHFPAAIQSTIGSWASVTGGFGGTNTTVLFDL